MMYPIPNPSAATGPNPNSLSAGFPQLDVERMDRLRRCQPWSVKIDGNGGFSRAVLPLDVVLVGDVGRSSSSRLPSPFPIASRSRCRRQ